MLKRPQTILWRMGLGLILATALVSAFAGWFIFREFKGFYFDQKREELVRLAPYLSERYSESIDRGDVAALRAQVARDADLDSRITVVDHTGLVLADSRADPDEMDNHRDRQEIDDAFTSGEGHSTRYSATVRTRMMYFASRMETDGEPVVLRVALPVSQIESELSGTFGVVLAVWVAFMLALGVVVFVISRHFAHQVGIVAEGAARFASGDLSHRLQRLGPKELRTLATSLNSMAGQLQKRIGQIEAQGREQQAILDSMSSGVVALDADQRIVGINNAGQNMLDVGGASARGRLFQEIVRDPGLHAVVAEALEDSDRATHEVTFNGKEPRRLQIVTHPLNEESDGTRGVLLVLNDVTQLRKLESLRSDFAANVSHELRTPVTNIRGYVETLREIGWRDESQAKRFLEIIDNNSRRLAAIIDDVMSLTKVEQPQMREQLERQTIPARNLVAAVTSEFEETAREKSIEIVESVPPEMALFVHPQLLEQAVSNLVSNAIKYSPPETTVMIELSEERGSSVISVRDEGPGIPRASIPRLFERFYRVDKARSRELGGTGLGLALVKYITNAHGGRVEVRSKVGSGAEFRLVLPRDDGGAAGESHQS